MRKICKLNNHHHCDCSDGSKCNGCANSDNFILLDDALAPIIPILWDKGYATTDSCSGHVSAYHSNRNDDAYIRFDANKCNCNRIINAVRSSIYELQPTINISLYDKSKTYIDIRLTHNDNYLSWLENLQGLYKFVWSIDINDQIESKSEKEIIDSLSESNLKFLYEGYNDTGFQKLIQRSEDRIYYSTISKRSPYATYKGLPINQGCDMEEELSYEQFIYEIHNHNDYEFDNENCKFDASLEFDNDEI